MQIIRRLPFVAAALSLGSQTGEALLTSRDIYTTDGCGGTPDFLAILSCITDPYTHAAVLFSDTPYVLWDQYLDENCQVYAGFSTAGRANGDCIATSDHTSRKMLLNANGTVTSTVYATSSNCNQQGAHIETLYGTEYFEESICENGKFGNFVYYNNAHPSPSAN
ncbi:hypothetical protein PF005_g12499 [Phytophthora fragariae]|uniref:Pectate lyase n=1 Tax=Phytophthora fragariae TaxID=53985 RepID=A0A6A3KD62_9STRA|nr:hypothetical protein PF009_g13941 [Phytophthora fragariae]KAE9005241.1 hypothetical protein PF011_g12129 [Phytophthora fragariae]KAE9107162.1 hypothetical protein PF010_g12377 [Phytophthora fragariae]KAE9107990.1 hypothetical protein PF007_g12831 [Phytophthora fragariae]KAE9142504.1 hypothetical protein PF006_g12393 [Phytophthora fragariae]